NVPAGKTEVQRIPCSSYSRRMARTPPVTSLGSDTEPEGMNRSGWVFSAVRETSAATPISPRSSPHLSSSPSVTDIGATCRECLGYLLEHVLDRELQLLRRRAVLGLPADEVVLTGTCAREPDHRVDDRAPNRKAHRVASSGPDRAVCRLLPGGAPCPARSLAEPASQAACGNA